MQPDDVSSANIDDIPLDEIYVPDGRRPVDDAKVEQLAKSIEELGLFHPIAVFPEDHRFKLIYGAYRLAAFRKLKRKTIPAAILILDNLHT
jgi:ParB-like chromosome segregation protein Spo0J